MPAGSVNSSRGRPSKGRVGTTTDQYGTPLAYSPIEPIYSEVNQLGDYAPAPEEPPAPIDTGGGGGGGSAAYDYTTDPVYAAYVAALDLDQTQRQQDTARRRDYLMADQTRLLDQTGQQGEQTRETISGAAESRGLFNSGARLRDLARQRSNQASREGQIREGTTRQSAELESQLAQYLAQQQLQRQRAQLGQFS